MSRRPAVLLLPTLVGVGLASLPEELVVVEHLGQSHVEGGVQVFEQLDGPVLHGRHPVVDVLHVLRHGLHLVELRVGERC